MAEEEKELPPETYREKWMPGESKYHPSVYADIEYYIQRGENLTFSGLAEYLSISRQCLYNWICKYENIKLLVMDMKCKAFFTMPMYGDEKRNRRNFEEL